MLLEIAVVSLYFSTAIENLINRSLEVSIFTLSPEDSVDSVSPSVTSEKVTWSEDKVYTSSRLTKQYCERDGKVNGKSVMKVL